MPTKYIVNTGEDEPVYEAMDEFFRSVVNKIGDRTDGPSEFEIRVGNHFSRRSEDDPSLTSKDDRTHVLLYREQPVAAVIETRDEMNYIRFTFFENLEGLTLN
jgi:hypothetical protein